ncbi:MAG: quinolinate synthase NadA [Candidatus Marinimicrobia bacterium]|nr:quinolinate synthase NadA [Candidatus Neomarinimicrobiota bacterium]
MIPLEKGVDYFTQSPVNQTMIDILGSLKERLSTELIVLAHHYQCDKIVAVADIVGDSLKLAQEAVAIKNKKYILFAGVHFMAESADILTESRRVVLMPDPHAGCALADMADIREVELVWQALQDHIQEKIIPVTYINSSAAIKAFVGKHGGTVCTSGNAGKIFEWCLNQGGKIFFLPDRYLGENTALEKRMSSKDLFHITFNPKNPFFLDGVTTAKVLLWDGYCSVHRQFTAQDVRNIRRLFPEVRVIVHPECRHEVVSEADDTGSTEKILKTVQESKTGSVWAIGTEAHLVNRLQKNFPDKTILHLKEPGYQCITMTESTPEKVHHVLSELLKGHIINRVHVEPSIAKDAYRALNKMLEITG